MAMMTEKQEVQMQLWLSRICERQNSGLTIKDWCNKNQLPERAYYYWLRKARRLAYLDMTGQKQNSVKEENAFIEISAPAEPVLTPEVKPVKAGCPAYAQEHTFIIRKGQILIELREDIPAALLPPILAALANAQAGD